MNTTLPGTVPDSPTEADFHRHWLQLSNGAATDEVGLAIGGGAVADRLAWVFMSGYQAAVRRCFPEFRDPDWMCFAVAEPKEGPACTLTGDAHGLRLDGEKSWIAGAGCVKTFVVSVGADEGRRFVRVRRQTPGVSVSLPRDPSFLREMHQGAAHFEGVQVTAEDVVEDAARAQWFRGAEPLYVLLAFNACLKVHAITLGDTRLPPLADVALELGRTLPGVLDDKSRIVPGLRSLREATAAVLQAGERLAPRFPPALQGSFEADALLFGMFGISGARP